jgi:fucose 4-O-acetylase-like acetyltransferase
MGPGAILGKNPSIDLLKGVLILLVMAGHAMELTHAQHLALWIGSGFRMPLMIGISGYLLNIGRLRNEPGEHFFGRYGERMLLPWLVAMIVYLLVSGWSLSWRTPIDLLLRPPFHLWYIPVLFFLILVARAVPLRPIWLLAIGVPFSLSIMYGFGPHHGAIGVSLLSPDSRYLRYPIYFFFGMLMAERGLANRYLGVALLTATLGMGWWSELEYDQNIFAFVSARLLMCLGLIALLPHFAALRLSFAPLNHIGRDSLFFYLWHPLVMGLMMATGIGAPVTLALSVPTLFALGRLSASHKQLRRWIGSTPPIRPPGDAQPLDPAPQPA